MQACPIPGCSQTFKASQRLSLSAHLHRSHSTSTQTFPCPVEGCNKGPYLTPQALSIHRRVHAPDYEDRKIKCNFPLCTFKTASLKVWKRHQIERHQGRPPYLCGLVDESSCSFHSSSLSAVRRHWTAVHPDITVSDGYIPPRIPKLESQDTANLPEILTAGSKRKSEQISEPPESPPSAKKGKILPREPASPIPKLEYVELRLSAPSRAPTPQPISNQSSLMTVPIPPRLGTPIPQLDLQIPSRLSSPSTMLGTPYMDPFLTPSPTSTCISSRPQTPISRTLSQPHRFMMSPRSNPASRPITPHFKLEAQGEGRYTPPPLPPPVQIHAPLPRPHLKVEATDDLLDQLIQSYVPPAQPPQDAPQAPSIGPLNTADNQFIATTEPTSMISTLEDLERLFGAPAPTLLPAFELNAGPAGQDAQAGHSPDWSVTETSSNDFEWLNEDFSFCLEQVLDSLENTDST